MSTPTTETLNGGSTMQVATQTSDSNQSSEAQKPLPGSPSADRVTSGMTVGSQVNVGPIKPVDRKTLEGSTPGDTRAKAAPAVLPNNPGPREQVGQIPLSSKTPAASAPQS